MDDQRDVPKDHKAKSINQGRGSGEPAGGTISMRYPETIKFINKLTKHLNLPRIMRDVQGGPLKACTRKRVGSGPQNPCTVILIGMLRM